MINPKILNLSKNVYNEKKENINKVLNVIESDDGLENSYKMSFIIFTYEAFKLNLIDWMLNEIEKINGKIIDYIYYPKIDEYKIIEHYKYHNPRDEKDIYGYNTCMPSVGWPIVRKRFSKPLIACVVIGNDENFNEKMLNLKGPTIPEKCSYNQLRSKAINKAYTAVHSSDDIYSALREAILFFGKEKIKKILNNSSFPCWQINHKMLRMYGNSISYNALSKKDIIRKIERLVNWHFLNHNRDYLHILNLDEINNFSLLQSKNVKTISSDLFTKNLISIYNFLIGLRKITDCEDISNSISFFKSIGIFDNEWEEAITESELLMNFLNNMDN